MQEGEVVSGKFPARIPRLDIKSNGMVDNQVYIREDGEKSLLPLEIQPSPMIV